MVNARLLVLKTCAIKRYMILLISISLSLASCNRLPKPDGKRTKEQFASSVRSFPYKAPEETVIRITNNYTELFEGMPKSKVADILGDPDYSDTIDVKSWLGMRVIGTKWIYCVYCTSQFVGTSGGEKFIAIYFDLEDKARWLVPEGIDNLREKGAGWGRNKAWVK